MHFVRFSTRRFPNFFMNIKYHWDFIIGKTCVLVSVFRDLVTADVKPIRTAMVVINVVYSIQTGVEVNVELVHIILYLDFFLNKSTVLTFEKNPQ